MHKTPKHNFLIIVKVLGEANCDCGAPSLCTLGNTKLSHKPQDPLLHRYLIASHRAEANPSVHIFCYSVVSTDLGSLWVWRRTNITVSSAQLWPMCWPHSTIQLCTELPKLHKAYRGESLASEIVMPGRGKELLSGHQSTFTSGTFNVNCGSH